MCECAHIRRDKMKNTRTTQQTKIKKCMRWTASGLLLAVLFVLVFAGTLSGAFGIENSLQQNGSDTVDFEYNLSDIIGGNRIAEAVSYDPTNKRAVMSVADVNKEVAITGLYGSDSTKYWTSSGDASPTYDKSYGYGWNPSFSASDTWVYPEINKSTSSTTKIDLSSISSAIAPGNIIGIKISATIYAFTTLSSNSGGTGHYTDVSIKSSFTASDESFESIASTKAENTGNNDKEESSTGTKEYSSEIGNSLYLKFSASYHKDECFKTGARGSTHKAFVKDIKITITVPRYTIRYNANKPNGATVESTGVTEDSIHDAGVAKQLTANGYAIAGYSFLGWTLTPYNTPQDVLPSGGFEDKASVLNLSTTDGAIVTLYAVWMPQFGLVYHENGDSYQGNENSENLATVTKNKGETIDLYTASNLPSNFQKLGYYFVGWAENRDSQVSIGTSIIAGENGTQRHIYAIWKPIAYTLSFDGNGSTYGSMIDVTGSFDNGNVSLPRNGFGKENVFFEKWTINSGGRALTFENAENAQASVVITVADFKEMLTNAQEGIDDQNVTLVFKVVWSQEFEFGKFDNGTGKWGSQNNPYVIHTQAQLEALALIVNYNCSANAGGTLASIQGSQYAYITDPNAEQGKGFANCYFKLANDLSMSYASSFTYSSISSDPVGNSGETVDKLFDGTTSGKKTKLCISDAKAVTIYVTTSVPIVVTSYSWWTGNDTSGNAGRNPNRFKIEGSNDGVNWYLIDDTTNNSWPTTDNTQVDVYDMNGAGKAGRYSKFRIYSTCSGGTWQANEFKFNYVTEDASTPIGISASKPFKGTFDGGKVDGGSYTISNLKTYGYDYSGLFGYVQGGTIKNVNLANLTVNNNGGKYHGGIAGELNGGTIEKCNVNGWVWGNEYIGGIVGRVSGASTISNCTTLSGSQINFNGSSDITRPRVGGIVGGVDGNGTFSVTISGCVNNAKINNANNGTYGFGGIVGYNSGQTVNISGCTNSAEINGKSETGGIIGYTDNSKIENCTNNGVVKGADNVGGIVGKICAGEITACENTKEVTAVSAIGGIVGFATSLTINGATNSGTITGTGGQVAGIVGYSDANGRMYGVVKNSGAINGGGMVGGIGGEYHGYWCDSSNNYGSFENSGAINGGSGSAIGGITGFADKEILSAVNKGNVIGGSAVGGIAGRCQAPVKNSYNEANIQGTVTINPGTTEVSGNPKGVYVGGIVGYTSAAATILHCYNTGNIKACNVDGTYLGSSNYVGGIVGFAQADVSYCANIHGIIEGNDYIGGIVGKSTSTINYCYDVEGQRILRYVSGRIGAITGDAGTVDYSWAVNEKTYSANLNSTATPNPTISTRGHWLTTAFAITPLAIDNGSYNEKVWTDILTQDINGFKVVGSVAANNFFVTDNGKAVSDSNYKYVKPLTTEGFTGDTGSVTVRYSATTDSDIRAHAEAITLPTASTVYNGSEQGFGYDVSEHSKRRGGKYADRVYVLVRVSRTKSQRKFTDSSRRLRCERYNQNQWPNRRQDVGNVHDYALRNRDKVDVDSIRYRQQRFKRRV